MHSLRLKRIGFFNLKNRRLREILLQNSTEGDCRGHRDWLNPAVDSEWQDATATSFNKGNPDWT